MKRAYIFCFLLLALMMPAIALAQTPAPAAPVDHDDRLARRTLLGGNRRCRNNERRHNEGHSEHVRQGKAAQEGSKGTAEGLPNPSTRGRNNRAAGLGRLRQGFRGRLG